SPPSSFSTLMTSAPMSASIRPQTGPAITWLRSRTRIPLSGPVRSAVIPRRLFFREPFRALLSHKRGAAADIPPTTLARLPVGNKPQCCIRRQRAEELRDHLVGHIREARWVPFRRLVLVHQKSTDAFEELAMLEEAHSQPVFNIQGGFERGERP